MMDTITMVKERYTISESIQALKQDFPWCCELDVPLSPLTSYRVGGPAAAFCTPETIEDLIRIVQHCVELQVPYFILGKGTNILVHDDGFAGVVISLENCCSRVFHNGDLLFAGAGITVEDLLTYCEEHGLGGLEFMYGIPGTVGGALRMNAGAYGGEIGDRVVRIDALDSRGNRMSLSPEEAGFGYRKAPGLDDKVLLGCWLLMEPADSRRLQQKRQELLALRKERQPLEYPSCGSVFKRPEGDFAGRLIEQAGCKGMCVGGAMVSPKHANFIVNTGNATAADIFELIRLVQQKVYEQAGVWLQLEVKLIGFSEEERKKVEGPHA